MRWDMGIGKETAEQLKEQAETQQSQFQAGRESVAEREGFEPSIEFPLYTLSKRAPSTTRPSLRFEIRGGVWESPHRIARGLRRAGWCTIETDRITGDPPSEQSSQKRCRVEE